MHSGTDLVAALLTFLALRVAVRPADREHPYGHGKAEHLAALGEGGFLVLASAPSSPPRRSTGWSAARQHDVDAAWWAIGVLARRDRRRRQPRDRSARRAARRCHSAALASNALHFASDLVGSIAVLVGLLLSRAGEPRADPVAALFVAGLVIIAARAARAPVVDVLMDRAPRGRGGGRARARRRSSRPRAAPPARARGRGRDFVDLVVAVRADAAVGQGHAVADASRRRSARRCPAATSSSTSSRAPRGRPARARDARPR